MQEFRTAARLLPEAYISLEFHYNGGSVCHTILVAAAAACGKQRSYVTFVLLLLLIEIHCDAAVYQD